MLSTQEIQEPETFTFIEALQDFGEVGANYYHFTERSDREVCVCWLSRDVVSTETL